MIKCQISILTSCKVCWWNIHILPSFNLLPCHEEVLVRLPNGPSDCPGHVTRLGGHPVLFCCHGGAAVGLRGHGAHHLRHPHDWLFHSGLFRRLTWGLTKDGHRWYRWMNNYLHVFELYSCNHTAILYVILVKVICFRRLTACWNSEATVLNSADSSHAMLISFLSFLV